MRSRISGPSRRAIPISFQFAETGVSSLFTSKRSSLGSGRTVRQITLYHEVYIIEFIGAHLAIVA